MIKKLGISCMISLSMFLGCNGGLTKQIPISDDNIDADPVTFESVTIDYYTVTQRALNQLCDEYASTNADIADNTCRGLAVWDEADVKGDDHCAIIMTDISNYESIEFYFEVLGHEVGHCQLGNHHEWKIYQGELHKTGLN